MTRIASQPAIDPVIDQALHDIRFHAHRRVEIFLSLSHELRSVVLLHLTKHILFDLISRVHNNELIEALEHLDPDEVTDIIQNISARRRKEIINALSNQLKHDVQNLLEFDPQTAAGLMNLNYIQIENTDTIAEVARQLKVHEKRTGRLPAILVMRQGKLAGYIPGHELGFAGPTDVAHKYIRHIASISYLAHKQDVLDQFKTYPHNKVAVLGRDNNVMGIIYSDDILRVLEEQQSASLYDFAGVHDEESVADSARTKVKFRYKWLIVNLATAFLAAFTVGLFDETIAKYVLLAVYMPIVAGMGGNAGTQTMAVLVRGITLKQIDLKSAWVTMRREMAAGAINGAINGLIVATVVLIFNHDVKIAIVLGLAMVINLLVAGFFGTMVPLLMQKFGKDPATSATVFITTATDVLGFIAFLGLATLVLN